MKAPIIVIGIGELGGVFARAFLRLGHPVVPITRGMNIAAELAEVTKPELVLLAVGEKVLSDVLAALPKDHRQHIVMLQNELLPRVWEPFDIEDPTVISVWFEKKPGQDVKVLKPSPVFGPQAAAVARALATQEIPCKALARREDLVFALAVKNVFVYTINICGLAVGGTTGTLWAKHKALATRVADEVLGLQERLTDAIFSRGRVYQELEAGFTGDPDHKCMGRSAPDRLTRLISLAEANGLAVPAIREIQNRVS